MECNATECNAMECNAMQCNVSCNVCMHAYLHKHRMISCMYICCFNPIDRCQDWLRQVLDMGLCLILPLVRFLKLLRYFEPGMQETPALSEKTIGKMIMDEGPKARDESSEDPCGSLIQSRNV